MQPHLHVSHSQILLRSLPTDAASAAVFAHNSKTTAQQQLLLKFLFLPGIRHNALPCNKQASMPIWVAVQPVTHHPHEAAAARH